MAEFPSKLEVYYLTDGQGKTFRAVHKLSAKLGFKASVIKSVSAAKETGCDQIFIVDSGYNLSASEREIIRSRGELISVNQIDKDPTAQDIPRPIKSQSDERGSFFTSGADLLDSVMLRNALSQILRPVASFEYPQLLRWGYKDLIFSTSHKFTDIRQIIQDANEISANSRRDFLQIWYALEILDIQTWAQMHHFAIRSDGVSVALEIVLSRVKGQIGEIDFIINKIAGNSEATTVFSILQPNTLRISVYSKLESQRGDKCLTEQGAIIVYRKKVVQEESAPIFDKAG
jgi:hypothetical protein